MPLISTLSVPADRGRTISKFLNRVAIAAMTLPLTFPAFAETVNQTLPPRVAQALKANKIESNALSVVMLPLNSSASPTFVNADVSVNPASTMKLVTTYAALELLGPNHQWKTEFHADGPIENGTLNGNLYLKGGGDPKLNMEKLWLLLRD
ncbi:MAG TPA: D-alanyl-D-alanine carboxypeptidase/D-alanyl-D-alanine-endopeptidase, partial [Pseudomonas sp.]|nr:D-alanyl-D-alanine carboxypeptidase/D-alanyl-D-alanine-endopeptidase [Pseudomonas sp.]